MDGFSLYSNLPSCLDSQEQEFLFYEMAKLKEEYEKTGNVDTQKKYLAIREKLITHNLRMCTNFALKYCQKYNKMNDFEDICVESTIALTKAIDDYDQSRGLPLAKLAYKYMETQIFNVYVKSRNDALNMTDDTQILDKDGDEVEDGFFRFLSDDENISDSFAQKEFVADILNYIENIENDRHRTALKMFLGLGYKRKYSQNEIAEVLSCRQPTISKNLNFEKQKLKEYIATNYSQSFLDMAKEVKRTQFATDAEKDQYIFDSYFGLNGLEKKGSTELSVELGIPIGSLHRKIYRISDKLTEKEKKELQLDEIKYNNKRKVKYDDEYFLLILNDYYGLENNPILSTEEILRKYQIKSRSQLYQILERAKKKFMPEEMDELNEKRKTYRDDKQLEKSALCYYMNKGLKGYEKTSQLGIEKELGISRNTVRNSIKYYQEYLDSLTTEEREKLLGEDVIPEQ